MPTHLPLLWSAALVLALAGCAQLAANTSAGATDGGVRSCRWQVGETHLVSSTFPGSGCALRDLAPSGDGAWLFAVCDWGSGSSEAWRAFVRRIDGAGVALSDGLSGTWPVRADSEGWLFDYDSLAIDDALARRAALIWSVDPLPGGPAFVDLGRRGVPEFVPVVLGLPLAGPRHLRAHRAGFTCVAERGAAPWGVSLVRLDPLGAQVAARDLGLPPMPVPFQRIALPDRSFVMTWTDAGQLHLRRYDEDGAARTDEAMTLDEHVVSAPQAAVVQAGDGLLAIWESGWASLSARRLDADGRPLAPARTITALDGYSAGLSATSAAGDVLVSAVVGETQPRVVVAVLDRDGVTRGEAIEVGRSRNPRWMRRFTRIVSTPGGALVAFEGEYRSVSTAPLRCEP
ncbi:MAG: hypothetical protein Q8S73_30795 [Deltaproteobacteria bacterium]|nr:hypothetical protein [Myxococcales bacterium]MDP3218531.1 hypothetical protein [Deltaproteobacteria bacterium]